MRDILRYLQAAAIIPSVSRVNDVNDDAISKDNGTW